MENMDNQSRGGIKISQIENYNEHKNIITDMMCAVCLNVVFKPVECFLCETLMCEECLQILHIAGKKCITAKCKSQISKANKFVREILGNLKITCEHCNKKNINYSDYFSHLEKCSTYLSSSEIQLLRTIKEKDNKIDEMMKDLEVLRLASVSNNQSQNKSIKDPYAHLTKEQLRTSLVSFSMPINQKMELYNMCVEGKIAEFKNLILNKRYPMLEEVSAHNYYWTPLHYAMHYGQIEIVKFICEQLKQKGYFDSAMRLESNDGRCPILCLLRSNSLGLEKKKEMLIKFLTLYPNVNISNEVKKEVKARDLESFIKKFYK